MDAKPQKTAPFERFFFVPVVSPAITPGLTFKMRGRQLDVALPSPTHVS